jgi:hypothetical protein
MAECRIEKTLNICLNLFIFICFMAAKVTHQMRFPAMVAANWFRRRASVGASQTPLAERPLFNDSLGRARGYLGRWLAIESVLIQTRRKRPARLAGALSFHRRQRDHPGDGDGDLEPAGPREITAPASAPTRPVPSAS